MRREMAEGLRYVLGHAYLKNIAACTATANLFGNVAGAVLLVFAVRELGMTAQAIGVAFSIGATGRSSAPSCPNRVSRRLGVGRTIIVFAGISGPALLPLALAPAGTSTPVLVALTPSSPSWREFPPSSTTWPRSASARRSPPPRMQGRMNATMRWFVWGTIPIGGVLGGAARHGRSACARPPHRGARGDWPRSCRCSSARCGDPRHAGAGRRGRRHVAASRA